MNYNNKLVPSSGCSLSTTTSLNVHFTSYTHTLHCLIHSLHFLHAQRTHIRYTFDIHMALLYTAFQAHTTLCTDNFFQGHHHGGTGGTSVWGPAHQGARRPPDLPRGPLSTGDQRHVAHIVEIHSGAESHRPYLPNGGA